MNLCPRCATDNHHAHDRCRACGTPLKAATKKTAPAKAMKKAAPKKAAAKKSTKAKSAAKPAEAAKATEDDGE